MEDNQITIGSDPEFVIMCGESISNALEIFSKVFKPDILCIKPKELSRRDIYDINATYSNDPKAFINESLHYIDIRAIFKHHPRFAAEILIDVLKKTGNTIEKIIDTFNISEKEINESMSEILLVPENHELHIHKSYEKVPFQELPKHIKSRILWITIKNRMIYKDFDIYSYIPEKNKEEFKDKYIDNVINYYSQYSKAGFPKLEKLPQIISEYIKDFILEYMFDVNYTEYFCSAEIGCDGNVVTGEMRPKYGNSPIEHFNEILKLIKELSKRLEPEIVCYGKELKVLAGTVQGHDIYGEEAIVLGGHIHIGYDVEQNAYVAKWLGKMLSIFVGIPLTLIEKPEEIQIRRQAYGNFNDTKAKSYGIEFRMPSSWLVSPQITIGALSLAYVVADEFITKVKDGTKSQAINVLFEYYELHAKLYYAMLHELQEDKIEMTKFNKLSDLSKKLYEDIKTMRLYPEYAEYINYIFNMIERGETWGSDADILTTWNKLF